MSEAAVRVVIVGRGIAAAMAAVHLARSLPRDATGITVVATADEVADPFGDIEASLPGFVHWNARFGISEAELVRQGCLSFSLGTAYSDWSATGGTSFQPLGETGAALGGVPFHQIAERLRQAGTAVRLSDYSLAAMAAQAGRFGYPSADPASPLSLLAYGVHIDQPLYARLMLREAASLGVALPLPLLREVVRSAAGDIDGVVLDDGTWIDGDLFIDATGVAATLISGIPEATWISWSQWLPCNRSVTLHRQSDAPPAPYAHIVAEASGWRRIVPGLARVTETVASSEDDLPAAGADPVTFEQGRRSAAWVGKCVAIGQAAALLEPTVPLGLELLHRSLDRLAALFPHGAPTSAERGEYNRRFAEEADRARDVVLARYLLSNKQGAGWERLRQQTPPSQLADKIALFRSRGRIPLLDGDLLDEGDWANLFDAQGERARRYDALADAIPLAQLQSHLTRMRQAMIAAIAPLPLHGDFLAGIVRSQAA